MGRRFVTPTDLIHARRRYCDVKGLGPSCDLEAASWQTPDGRIHKYREQILPEILHDARACAVFVTKAVDQGAGVPRAAREQPYTVTTLCQGGRKVTGGQAFATLTEAREGQRWRATRRPIPRRTRR